MAETNDVGTVWELCSEINGETNEVGRVWELCSEINGRNKRSWKSMGVLHQ